jgi:type VI secretion system protein ImpK
MAKARGKTYLRSRIGDAAAPRTDVPLREFPMTSPPLQQDGTSTPVSVTPVGRGRLALILQEVFTSVTRLRTDRQAVSDAGAFRAHLLQLLQRAESDARAAGYESADSRLALFAAVALLDESALNSRQPALADWARRTLQEELFGGHMGGEWFFQHVDQLLERPDTPALIDLLEVHQLCLLLGFRGKYGGGDGGALHAIAARIGDRVQRARGAPGDLTPQWRPADDAVAGRDPWIRRLTIGLAAGVVLALALWVISTLMLDRATGELHQFASQSTASATTAAPAASAPR